uniref:Uncharacterized protein n=1 Tax=Rhodnius prolixus TaxID=13249 RepID=T1HXZ2_RHOPR
MTFNYLPSIITPLRITNYQQKVTGSMKNPSVTQSAIPTTGYIRRYQLAPLLGMSLSTLDRKVKNGTLPKPTKLGEKITAFDAVDIQRWLAERRESSNA